MSFDPFNFTIFKQVNIIIKRFNILIYACQGLGILLLLNTRALVYYYTEILLFFKITTLEQILTTEYQNSVVVLVLHDIPTQPWKI